MDYVSNKSGRLETWLREGLDDKKIEKIIRLERASRIILKIWELTQSAEQKDFHLLARAIRGIEMESNLLEPTKHEKNSAS